MKRFTQLPVTLFRIQAKPQVNLRDFAEQISKGRTSYDLKTVSGLVLPMEGDKFHTPNGMSLRPKSDKMLDILRDFKGSPRVYCLHEGMNLPEGLVVIHEHSDHWSLQTSTPISLPDLNNKMTALLATTVNVTKEQFLAAQEDEEDQDN
jgi:hypothetical protein